MEKFFTFHNVRVHSVYRDADNLFVFQVVARAGSLSEATRKIRDFGLSARSWRKSRPDEIGVIEGAEASVAWIDADGGPWVFVPVDQFLAEG